MAEKQKLIYVFYLDCFKAFDTVPNDPKVEGAAETICDTQPQFCPLLSLEGSR